MWGGFSGARGRTWLTSIGVVLVLGAGLSPVAAQAPGEVPDPRGQAAIDRLGSSPPAVTRNYGMSAAQLHVAFLQDDTLSVDAGGRLFYVDRSDGSASADPAPGDPAAAPPTTDPVFGLHSRPGANHTIYLDFDGHTTEGTTWNSAYGVTTIESPPYDIDGDSSTWSASELSRIADTFAIVAEDFALFDVDVTTEAPAVDRLINSGGSDVQWGVRVVITDDTFADCGCGGHAYINSFNWNTDIPAWPTTGPRRRPTTPDTDPVRRAGRRSWAPGTTRA